MKELPFGAMPVMTFFEQNALHSDSAHAAAELRARSRRQSSVAVDRALPAKAQSLPLPVRHYVRQVR